MWFQYSLDTGFVQQDESMLISIYAHITCTWRSLDKHLYGSQYLFVTVHLCTQFDIYNSNQTVFLLCYDSQ